MTLSIATPLVNADPGYLFYAPLGSTPPDSTSTGVVGSKFNVAWSAPWVALGMTTAGSTFHYNLTTANIEAAESFDPIAVRTTGRTASVDFGLMDFAAKRLVVALNGATTTVTGTTTTTSTKVTPPAPGSEVRFMLGWESQNNDIRIFTYQCINSGDIAMAFQKAPTASVIPFTVNAEISPTYQTPMEFYFAGVSRG